MSPAASFVSTVPLALVGLTTAAVTAAATVFYVAGGARGRGSGGSGAETAPTVASPTPDDLQQQLHHPLSLPSTQAKAQGADGKILVLFKETLLLLICKSNLSKVLSLSALSSLIATHTSYTLHEAAVQLLLDRAMTTDYLSSLLRPLTLLVLLSRSAESESSQPHPTPDLLILVKQSLAAVQQLTKQGKRE